MIDTGIIIAALEGIALVSAALGAVYKWIIRPLQHKVDEMMEPVRTLQKEVEEHDKKLRQDWQKLQQLDKVAEYNTELLLKDTEMLLATMKHLRTGNNTGKMDTLISDIDSWLISSGNPLKDSSNSGAH